MPDASAIYNIAVLRAETAVVHDKKGELELAIKAYEDTLEKIHEGLAIDSDSDRRKQIKEEENRYSTRVTLLKCMLMEARREGVDDVRRAAQASGFPLAASSHGSNVSMPALVSVVSSLTEQARGLVKEVQAAQMEAEISLKNEKKAREEAAEANRELSALREQFIAARGHAEALKKERDSVICEFKNPLHS